MAINVLVLFGGISTEYLISCRSAFNIISGLRAAGFGVMRAGITRQGEWLRYDGPDEAIDEDRWEPIARQFPAGTANPVRSPRDFILQFCDRELDVVFPAVHGINSEDGTLQGLLQLSGFPYVGCGVLASAAAMDKRFAKMIFKTARLPQCPYTSAEREAIENDPGQVADAVIAAVGLPCFLKPSNGGSSIGTARADTREALIKALPEAARYDCTVVVEAFIDARELEVAVRGNDCPQASPVGEIVTADPSGYYDYETKYFNPDGAREVVPAPISKRQSERIRRLAVKAYRALGCAGLARVDFFLDRSDGKLYLNEVNTLPGFNSISMYPKAWAAAGLPLAELTGDLCRLAIEHHHRQARQELV